MIAIHSNSSIFESPLNDIVILFIKDENEELECQDVIQWLWALTRRYDRVSCSMDICKNTVEIVVHICEPEDLIMIYDEWCMEEYPIWKIFCEFIRENYSFVEEVN